MMLGRVMELENKLRKCEAIEMETGISLDILFKALDDGFFFYHKHYGYQYCDFASLCYGGEWRLTIEEPRDDYERNLEFFLKDYGDTWALTKKELKEGTGNKG